MPQLLRVASLLPLDQREPSSANSRPNFALPAAPDGARDRAIPTIVAVCRRAFFQPREQWMRLLATRMRQGRFLHTSRETAINTSALYCFSTALCHFVGG